MTRVRYPPLSLIEGLGLPWAFYLLPHSTMHDSLTPVRCPDARHTTHDTLTPPRPASASASRLARGTRGHKGGLGGTINRL